MQRVEMPSKRPRVCFLLDESVRNALGDWADEEDRSLANLCERIVTTAVEEWEAKRTTEETKQKPHK